MKDREVSSGLARRHPPVTPGGKGRFGDFDVLGQVSRWDLVTAGVVLARLDTDPQLSFFTAEEEPTVRALTDLLLGQHDEPRVPVVEMLDKRLLAGETDGWRYEDMPEDSDAWRRSLAALDDEARALHGERFSDLPPERQARIVQGVQDADEWHGFSAGHLWSLWTRYACSAFYSHPWTWNEIGFGGPAYPRGYKNMGVDRREGWERPEVDARDPVPWAERREEALRAHEERQDASPSEERDR
ncbi:gluconate 2-dehydrogenase subunit 3 family protein [Acidiferrimicrobium sp. IK]|uniref:gluconate 2-dehydrogenase subunit 3 family protein n=1 Tax=Acidiferrimicrobium sp. IK TaxID=2871700 RepID=UPI0021CB5B25|nr:gluconate 2-dehydrogenase subunit 3 family protein [Acidiferrimicrobium sp. IK]MCU4183103.1 gluconate 2-dehydrogenase subunit 3 family protein [Acidiferrimicrobium sp. IK]